MTEDLGERIEQLLSEITDVQEAKERLQRQYDDLKEDYEKNRKDLSEAKEKDERSRAELGTMRDTLEATIRQLEVAKEALEILKQEMELFSQPPLAFAVVLGVNPDGTADVYLDIERVFRVGVSPEVDRDRLNAGVFVLLEAKNNAIVSICDNALQTLFGEVMSYIGPQSETHALVASATEDESVVMKMPGVSLKDVSAKSKVRVWKRMLVGVINEEQLDVNNVSSRYMQMTVPNVTREDIGGLDMLCEKLQALVVDPLKYPGLKEMYNQPRSNHVLLSGPPGNGKTQAVRFVAKLSWDAYGHLIQPYAGGNLLYVGGTEPLDRWVGTSEAAIRNAFETCVNLHKKSGAPIFLIFDDCEVLFKARGQGISSDVNESNVTTILTCLEGFETLVGVNVYLLSNRIDLVDPALTSRIQHKYFISPPDTPDRAMAVFMAQLRRLPPSKDLTLEILEKAGGDISREEAVRQAREFLAESVVERIFNQKEENSYMEVEVPGEGSQIFWIKDMLSGRIIRDIVDAAGRLAIDRDKQLPSHLWPSGISPEDLLNAVENELVGNEGLPHTHASLREWLRQRGFGNEIERARIRDLRKSRRRLAEAEETKDIQ